MVMTGSKPNNPAGTGPGNGQGGSTRPQQPTRPQKG